MNGFGSLLITKSGPLVLIPYPAVTVDMGQYLERFKEPSDLERLWIDYVTALARGPKLIQIVRLPSLQSGSIPLSSEPPNGAEALRRVLENFRNQKLVWVTDVEAVMAVAGEKQ